MQPSHVWVDFIRRYVSSRSRASQSHLKEETHSNVLPAVRVNVRDKSKIAQSANYPLDLLD